MSTKRKPAPPRNPGLCELIRGKRQWTPPLSPAARKAGFLGWHERGYLPHRDEPGLVQFVTYRLDDAFSEAHRNEWEPLLNIEDNLQRQRQLEAYLDRGRGACHLGLASIATTVENALRRFHGSRYELRAWVIMPNHVHVLFQPRTEPMWRTIDAWKGYTAKAANSLLNRRGRFWQAGYWDTWMRDSTHAQRTVRYIESNPVKAGLVPEAAGWCWSSARFRDAYGRLQLPADS